MLDIGSGVPYSDTQMNVRSVDSCRCNAARLPRTGRTLLAGLAAALCLSGCVGYRLGSTLPPDLRTLHVPPFANKCGEPLIEIETTQATIQDFQKDGTLRIVDADRADAILEVALVKYVLEPLRYEKDRSKTTKEYRLQITADVTLTRAGTNKILTRSQALGETTFLPGSDLTSAKRAALPAAAVDLAHHIVQSVVEYW